MGVPYSWMVFVNGKIPIKNGCWLGYPVMTKRKPPYVCPSLLLLVSPLDPSLWLFFDDAAPLDLPTSCASCEATPHGCWSWLHVWVKGLPKKARNTEVLWILVFCTKICRLFCVSHLDLPKIYDPVVSMIRWLIAYSCLCIYIYVYNMCTCIYIYMYTYINSLSLSLYVYIYKSLMKSLSTVAEAPETRP